jgi:hypothetical protein
LCFVRCEGGWNDTHGVAAVIVLLLAAALLRNGIVGLTS